MTNAGHLHIIEPGMEEMLQEVVKAGMLKASVTPVSYTHLDVYKRQLLPALPPSGEQADYHRHEDISRVVE